MIADRDYMREPDWRGGRSVTAWLILANVLLFVVQMVADRFFGSFPFDAYFALSETGIRQGYLWQLITFQFLHGGLIHLLLNCWALYVFGRELEEHLGRDTARRLGVALIRLSFGASTVDVMDLLQEDAFAAPLAPPLPDEFRMVDHTVDSRKSASSAGQRLSMEGVRATVGARLKIDAEVLGSFDLRQFIGPFRRCVDVFVPEWVPIIDIPDITFNVTQDVNGDGVEETIVSEGLFKVRWNAGSLSPVKLIASPPAISIPECC